MMGFQDSSWFPPVNSGGLIEASSAMRRACRARSMFPPVNSGGLIEAVVVGPDDVVVAKFPPVNSGGLIEATLTDANALSFDAQFPPVNSGGLIEARHHRWLRSRVDQSGFRR